MNPTATARSPNTQQFSIRTSAKNRNEAKHNRLSLRTLLEEKILSILKNLFSFHCCGCGELIEFSFSFLFLIPLLLCHTFWSTFVITVLIIWSSIYRLRRNGSNLRLSTRTQTRPFKKRTRLHKHTNGALSTTKRRRPLRQQRPLSTSWATWIWSLLCSS